MSSIIRVGVGVIARTGSIALHVVAERCCGGGGGTPVEAMAASLRARLAGWEVRDIISIHTPDGLLLAPVLRNPFRGTLTANVLQHGADALDIDGCRIGNCAADD